MFYIVCSVISIVVLICLKICDVKFKNKYCDLVPYYAISFFLLTVFSSLSMIAMISGLSDYPNLKANYTEIVRLNERVDSVKNAYYKTTRSGDSAINGSLDNMKQSTNLSSFISNLAIKESRYLYDLEKSKIHKNTNYLRWFKDGLFIDNKVNDLPTTFK